MSGALKWFTVALAINNVSTEEGEDVAADILEEMSYRNHLRNPRILWEAERRQVFAQFDIESTDRERAARAAAEELYEIRSAVMERPEGTNIEVLDTGFPDRDAAR